MSKCNAETCKFFDFCKFSEDNFDPASCVIGAEISRRVMAKLADDAAKSALVAIENVKADIRAEAKAKTETKPATAKKGGAKK